MGLKDYKENFVFNASRDWKPVEMCLDVRRVMGKSGNESCSRIEYNLKTDQQRITVVDPGAEKACTMEVKIGTNGSQTPQLEVGGAS